METLLLFVCKNCKVEFGRTKSQSHSFTTGRTKNNFCSVDCHHDYHQLTKPCGWCFTPVTRIKGWKPTKSGHFFCNRSCSAKYNNAHKTHGTRRSKLEIHLEKHIRKNYPAVRLLCNDKTAINSELDFYFPDLKFAMELNGIFHYEPIYGEDKLERIQDNDKQKLISCYQNGIELAIINSSHIKSLTKKRKSEMEDIVELLLGKVLKRTVPTV